MTGIVRVVRDPLLVLDRAVLGLVLAGTALVVSWWAVIA